jgi:hypothetical protein
MSYSVKTLFKERFGAMPYLTVKRGIAMRSPRLLDSLLFITKAGELGNDTQGSHLVAIIPKVTHLLNFSIHCYPSIHTLYAHIIAGNHSKGNPLSSNGGAFNHA